MATLTRWVGPDADSWLRDLPRLSAAISDEWQLELDEVLLGGSTSLVIAGRSPDHGPVVLKVPFPDPENHFEPEALQAYGGEGAVRLLEFDSSSRAMLLERAVPGSPLSDLSDLGQALEIACRLLVRLRRRIRSTGDLPHCSDFLDGWLQAASEAVASSPDAVRPALVRAIELGRRLDAGGGPGLLVNRDAHLGNFVRAEREDWLLIDPKPMIGEPAFEGGFLLLDAMDRNRHPGLAPTRQLLATIAANLGVGADRVLAWALIRAFDNTTWARSVGEDPSTWESRALLLARLS